MKLFLVALLVIATVFADNSKEVDDEKMYPTKWDGVDIDEILNSDRLFDNYFKCLMDRGNCTPDGRELKRRLPDALQTECSKCSEQQRGSIERVLKFLIEKKKKEWEELQAKYDKDGVYLAKYRPEAKKHGIEV